MALISVLMGVYRENLEHLHLAIDSILSQTYNDFEFLIVLDDPFNKDLLDTLNGYKKSDDRIKLVVNKENIGLAMSLNRAIEIANGKYLARMDADDISLPDRFKKQIDYLEEHPEVVVLGTNKIVIDETGIEVYRGGWIPTSHDGISEVLHYSNIMVHPSVMMRTDIIRLIGGYRAFPTTQDYDLWSRLIDKGYILNNITDYLIKYRINSTGISMSKAYKQFIIGKYIEKLEIERKERGSDSFSVEQLLQFMENNQVNDPEVCKRFQNARAILEEGRIRIKNGKLITGGIKLFRAAHMHPYMKEEIVNLVKSVFIKQKYRAK